MFHVELFLPLHDDGDGTAPRTYERIKSELTDRFGGVTAFVRSPAEGLWKNSDSEVVADSIVIVEVMVEDLDREWWRQYRENLERELHQEEILIRATEITRL